MKKQQPDPHKHPSCDGHNKFKLRSVGIDLIFQEQGVSLSAGTSIKIDDSTAVRFAFDHLTALALVKALEAKDIPMKGDYSFTRAGKKDCYCYAPTCSEESTYLIEFIKGE